MSKNTARQKFKDIFKLGDIFILLVVLCLVALTIAFALKGGASSAEIYIDGKLAYTLDLSTDTSLELLDGKMTIEVSSGQIYVVYSDCPEGLCTHSTALGRQGGVIVCLPNRVVIKVDSKEVDAIT